MGFEGNWRDIARNGDLKKIPVVSKIIKKPTKPHSQESPSDWRESANNNDITSSRNKNKQEARSGDLNLKIMRDVFDGAESKPENTIN